eukprot:1672045-Prymnesium_polylepis.1
MRSARSSTLSSQRCARIFAGAIGRSPAVPSAASSSTTKCGPTTRTQHQRSLRSPLGITDASELQVQLGTIGLNKVMVDHSISRCALGSCANLLPLSSRELDRTPRPGVRSHTSLNACRARI